MHKREGKRILTHTRATLAPQPPIEPRKATPERVVISSYDLDDWEGVNIWCRQSPPDDLSFPPFTQHQVLIQFNDGPRVLQERGGRRYEGPWHREEIMIVRARQRSQWRMQGPTDNLHIDIEQDLLERIAFEVYEKNPVRVELHDIFGVRDDKIVGIGYQLLEELKTIRPGRRVYTESLGHQLAVHLLRTFCTVQPLIPHYKGGLPPHKLRIVCDYIDTHLSEKIRDRELAKLCKLSTTYFIPMFSLSIGDTPQQYIKKQRMQRAKVLLKDTQLSITEIASRMGYKTPSSFAYQFHRHTGKAPQAFRDTALI
jgi:AraC family transcriptional regulator